MHSVTTGRVLAHLSPPRPGFFFAAVAATGDDRKFVLAAQGDNGPCYTWLYQLTLSASGQVAGLTPLRVPQITGTLSSGSIAASGDGQTVAYYAYLCGARTGDAGDIGVIHLATGQVSRWSTSPPGEQPESLSLSGDGRLLGFTDMNLGSASPSMASRILPTDAPQGTLASRSRIVFQGDSPGIYPTALSTDGTELYGCSTAGSAGADVTIHAYDSATGRLVRVVHTGQRVADSGAPFCSIGRSTSGRYLLSQVAASLARVDFTTGKVTALPATGLYVADVPDLQPDIAW